MEPNEEKITVSEASALSSIPGDRIRRAITKGYLPATKRGPRLWEFKRGDFDKVSGNYTHRERVEEREFREVVLSRLEVVERRLVQFQTNAAAEQFAELSRKEAV